MERFFHQFSRNFVALESVEYDVLMFADVVIRAFEKVKEEKRLTSPWQCAQQLEIIVQENGGGPYSAKSLSKKWKAAQEDNSKEITIRKEVIDALCRYLGYDDYSDYLTKNADSIPGRIEGKRAFRKRLIITISISFVVIIGFAYYHLSQPRMMVWNGTQYEEVDFDLNQYSLSQLKAYREDRIEKFRKVEPDCSYEFFDDEGIELLWYGKNDAGELEFFTDLAKHPETGRTLKKITPYMIKKYICPTYPNN